MANKKTAVQKASKNVSAKKRNGKNWVLAIDPFSDLDPARIRDFIVSLAESEGATVYAAYVLAPASFNWTGDFSGAWLKRYKPLATQRLQELFPSSVIRPTVVPCLQTGLRASVKTLVHFAQKVKAERIVISTHARSGLERLAMGSFAETLILASKIPVLVLNPSQVLPGKIERILVPTDLSRRSEKHLALVTSEAALHNAEVILFYKQPDPLDPMVQQGVYSLGGGWVSVQNFIDEEVEMKRLQLEKLRAQLSKKGVRVSTVLDSSAFGLIESIERAAADKSADLISVRSEAGPWSAAILGSVARGLVRTAKIPVQVAR